jgi:uncharacterized OB-fold protein
VSNETCSSCGHITKPFYTTCPKCEGEKNRDKVERLRGVIREFKESVSCDMDPQRERELMQMLVNYDHPDVKGFMGWLSEERDRARSGKPAPRKKEWQR